MTQKKKDQMLEIIKKAKQAVDNIKNDLPRDIYNNFNSSYEKLLQDIQKNRMANFYNEIAEIVNATGKSQQIMESMAQSE